MDDTAATPAGRRIKWQNVSTVLSAAILIGAALSASFSPRSHSCIDSASGVPPASSFLTTAINSSRAAS